MFAVLAMVTSIIVAHPCHAAQQEPSAAEGEPQQAQKLPRLKVKAVDKAGNPLYAIALGWAGGGKSIAVRSLNKDKLGERAIRSVRMIGSDESIEWSHTDDALHVTFPNRQPCEYAFVFRIELQ